MRLIFRFIQTVNVAEFIAMCGTAELSDYVLIFEHKM